MKVLPQLGLAAILAFALAGCSQANSNETMGAAQLRLSADHNSLSTGDTTTVTANTGNLGDARIHWTVSPNTAKLSVVSGTGRAQATFSASQPGSYIVKAWATRPDGSEASDQTNITVNGPIPASKF